MAVAGAVRLLLSLVTLGSSFGRLPFTIGSPAGHGLAPSDISIASVERGKNWTLALRGSSRLTIIMWGQSARPNCAGKRTQLKAFFTQRSYLISPLQEAGFNVQVIIATNDCPDNPTLKRRSWRNVVIAAFRGSSVLNVTLDDCENSPNKRCLAKVCSKLLLVVVRLLLLVQLALRYCVC